VAAVPADEGRWRSVGQSAGLFIVADLSAAGYQGLIPELVARQPPSSQL